MRALCFDPPCPSRPAPPAPLPHRLRPPGVAWGACGRPRPRGPLPVGVPPSPPPTPSPPLHHCWGSSHSCVKRHAWQVGAAGRLGWVAPRLPPPTTGMRVIPGADSGQGRAGPGLPSYLRLPRLPARRRGLPLPRHARPRGRGRVPRPRRRRPAAYALRRPRRPARHATPCAAGGGPAGCSQPHGPCDGLPGLPGTACRAGAVPAAQTAPGGGLVVGGGGGGGGGIARREPTPPSHLTCP